MALRAAADILEGKASWRLAGGENEDNVDSGELCTPSWGEVFAVLVVQLVTVVVGMAQELVACDAQALGIDAALDAGTVAACACLHSSILLVTAGCPVSSSYMMQPTAHMSCMGTWRGPHGG